MEYREKSETESAVELSEEHARKKEKRYISLKRQRQHKQHLLNGLSYRAGYKPSIWRESEWNYELKKYVDTNRIKRGKRSRKQKCLKKASCRKVRQLQHDALPPKGNYYRRVFDYWCAWL